MTDVIAASGLRPRLARRSAWLLGGCVLAGCGVGGASNPPADEARDARTTSVVAAPPATAVEAAASPPNGARAAAAPRPLPRAPEPGEVPRIRTWYSPEGLLTALARGHLRAFGEEAPWPRLAGGYALCAFENASGAAVYNFNFGNLVARSGPTTHARWPVEETGGEPMQAHASADEGAAAFWRTMRHVHGAALRAFDDGKYREAVAALAKYGYFRADPARYEAALPSLASGALSRLIPAVRKEAAARGVAVSELPVEPRTTFADDLAFDRELP